MTDKDRIAAMGRLQDSMPCLQRYYPPGWKDFRSPLPLDWRSGLFANISDWGEPWESVGAMATPMNLRASFGGVRGAVDAASSVSERLGVRVVVGTPEESSRWKIEFQVPDEIINW